MTDKLLPCPFCGGEPTIVRRAGASGIRCTCAGKRFLHTYGKTVEEATTSWNDRASPPETHVEALARRLILEMDCMSNLPRNVARALLALDAALPENDVPPSCRGFAVGDQVVCIDNSYPSGRLTIGATYTVRDIGRTALGAEALGLVGYGNPGHVDYHSSRFKLASTVSSNEKSAPETPLRGVTDAERIEDLRLAAKAIRAYMPETLPADDDGKIHFARALAEAAADAIEAALAAEGSAE
ncbi:Lar family restriction alleviation protein [Neorhizobium alkalisoli]|uniref:Restriction alleviation protein Lar n=1 Tax=Neorhizobium alkalisoli TaxID=528178 RepID=A0A561QSG0_9HYPH|nr:Lar family restriction alleviation protein [Neorhizobium alkalisoli]TWF53232.1 restriction alleviation protein Lar [Neorhizobium alkalisoli]